MNRRRFLQAVGGLPFLAGKPRYHTMDEGSQESGDFRQGCEMKLPGGSYPVKDGDGASKPNGGDLLDGGIIWQ
jgi:hypothetical protein